MIIVKKRKSEKCYGQEALFISFPYDFEIISKIRKFPNRYWHPDTKEWELPLNNLDQLKSELRDYEVEYDTITERNKLDFEFKTKPFEHQLISFEYALTHDRWLLGDEMGLGKSKESIDIAVYKKQTKGYKHCLIICGVNGLKWNWVNEVKTHSNEGAYILGQRTTKNKIKIGSTADKIADLKTLLKSANNSVSDINEYFIITNIETLRNSEIQANLVKLCKQNIFGMIIADEVHRCKNPNSQQGKGFLKTFALTMIAMTGTPLMNNPMDLYIILKWLGYEKHAFYSFKNHYCVMGGYGGYEIVGYRNLDKLQDQLNSIMLRRRKEDVLNLPEKTYIDEYVDLTPKQLQIYREVTADLKSNIDQIKISPNPLAALIRLRQATGYTGILSSTVKESAKLDRMEELVDDAIANDRKVIIFSNWTQMTDVIKTRLAKKYKGVAITGETPDVERQVNVNHFQNNPDCKYIIGTAGAMGTGLTLTAGTVEIFLDEPWNMALKEQCVDRCHRIGQKSNLTIYTILAKGTIDERIHDIVTQKGIMADAIVDGKLTKNKEEIINFLLS